MTPNHELFRLIYQLAEAKAPTFDFLPEAGTKYPFIYIGENTAQWAKRSTFTLQGHNGLFWTIFQPI